MACGIPQGGHKNRDAEKKRSSNKVRGVSPEAGRESVVGKICESGRESQREEVMDGENGEMAE